MEGIREKIRELDLSGALRKSGGDKLILDYLKRITRNSNIWNASVVRHFDFKNQEHTPQSALTLEERSFLQLVSILLHSEGLFGGIINLAVYSLIINEHHDIWSEFHREFVSSFEDILDLQLDVKMKFLEKHGYGFLCEFCPKDIRNAIAHSSFAVEQDGRVRLLGKRRKVFSLAELTGIVQDMMVIGSLVSDIWAEELEKMGNP